MSREWLNIDRLRLDKFYMVCESIAAGCVWMYMCMCYSRVLATSCVGCGSIATGCVWMCMLVYVAVGTLVLVLLTLCQLIRRMIRHSFQYLLDNEW